MYNKKLGCHRHAARHLYEHIRKRPPHNYENNAFITYSQYLMRSMMGIPSSYQVHIWYGETRMAGLQSGEGCTMIDSVVWAHYVNVTDTQTVTQPCRHGNSCPNALQWATKTITQKHHTSMKTTPQKDETSKVDSIFKRCLHSISQN